MIDLYNDYECNTDTRLRNKVILGFIVFQAIRSNELQNIKIDDIDLHKMTISISKSKYTNERTLKLNALQVLHLYTYVNEVRCRLASFDSKQLLISKKSNKLNNVKSQLFKHLKKYNYNTIRTSVIMHWLTNNDLRYVQYFCGHKYISSTENYIKQDILLLQKQVVKCFPLK